MIQESPQISKVRYEDDDPYSIKQHIDDKSKVRESLGTLSYEQSRKISGSASPIAPIVNPPKLNDQGGKVSKAEFSLPAD